MLTYKSADYQATYILRTGIYRFLDTFFEYEYMESTINKEVQHSLSERQDQI